MPADARTASFDNVARYEALLDVVRGRMTNRAFAPWDVPREHFEMIPEAARHAPSGANAQPRHYVVVTDPEVSWDRFEASHFMTEAEIDEWVRTTRHKVMYRDESKVD
jgi:nitroreductase